MVTEVEFGRILKLGEKTTRITVCTTPPWISSKRSLNRANLEPFSTRRDRAEGIFLKIGCRYVIREAALSALVDVGITFSPMWTKISFRRC